MSRISAWRNPGANLSVWMEYADERYIAARFLYHNGFWGDFGIIASFALELYLKTFLIFHTEKNPITTPQHDLKCLLKECGEHDDFFSDINDPIEIGKERGLDLTYGRYLRVFRYPGPSSENEEAIRSAYFGLNELILLDDVAFHVRKCVKFPDTYRDRVADLIAGRSPRGSIDYIDECAVRKALLEDNSYFVDEHHP